LHINQQELLTRKVTNLTFPISKIDAECRHGTNNSNQRLNRVAVYYRLKLLVIFTCETTFVDNSAATANKIYSLNYLQIAQSLLPKIYI